MNKTVCGNCDYKPEKPHIYEKCDHAEWDGKIGCDNCFNLFSVNKVRILKQ